MRAEMQLDGTIVLSTYEPLEQYALEHWQKQYEAGEVKVVVQPFQEGLTVESNAGQVVGNFITTPATQNY